MQTAQQIVEGGRLGCAALVHVADERLREKEFGCLDRLTRAGITASFPEEARRRADVGKFYYRPPGGGVFATSVRAPCNLPIPWT